MMVDVLQEEQRIPPSGGVIILSGKTGTEHIIFEPIGTIGDDAHYVWFYNGQRGLSTLQIEEDPETKTKSYWIDFSGQRFQFEDKPISLPHSMLRKLIHIPNIENIEKWTSGQYQCKTNLQVYTEVLNYFRLFGDYEEVFHPYIMTLSVFQTYLLELLNAVFYLPINGDYGAGKSTIMKAMSEVSYHGILVDSISPALRVRLTELCRPSWFQDELDETEKDDGIGMAIARTGYERGSFYGRWNMDKNEPEVFEHFAPLIYTTHVDPSDSAFRSRSLAEITISKSRNFRIPAINMHRRQLSEKIGNDLFFWRFEVLDKALHRGFALNRASIDLEELSKPDFDIDRNRSELYDQITAPFTEKEKNLLMKLFGRENQLGFIALIVENILGVDVIDHLIDAINIKLEEERMPTDPCFEYFADLVSEYVRVNKLAETYARGDEPEGKERVLLKDFTIDLEAWSKERKLKPPRTQTIGSWTRTLGFRTGKTKIKIRDGALLILTKGIVESLKDRASISKLDKEKITQTSLDVTNVTNVTNNQDFRGEE